MMGDPSFLMVPFDRNGSGIFDQTRPPWLDTEDVAGSAGVGDISSCSAANAVRALASAPGSKAIESLILPAFHWPGSAQTNRHNRRSDGELVRQLAEKVRTLKSHSK